MKIISIIKFIFHFFIFFYMFYLFYWQSKNYKMILYSIPSVLKIGIPTFNKEFFYQDINGEFSGTIIDVLNRLFIKKLNINIEYLSIGNHNEYYDCVLQIGREDIDYKNRFIYSNEIIFEIPMLLVNKNNKKNKKIVTIKNDLLYFFYINIEDYLFLDSIEEAILFLTEHENYDLLISKNYYNRIEGIIIEKNYKLENYSIKIINKKIDNLYLLFKPELYWLISFFNRVLLKLKER